MYIKLFISKKNMLQTVFEMSWRYIYSKESIFYKFVLNATTLSELRNEYVLQWVTSWMISWARFLSLSQ